jgi:ATP-binding cassette, subfamily B, bacterial PglK
MISDLSKLFYLLSEHKIKLLWITMAFTGTSVIEALGVGLIAPFLKVAESGGKSRPGWLVQFAGILGIDMANPDQTLLTLGLLIVGIFLSKSVFLMIARFLQYRFLAEQKRFQMLRLLWAYLNAPYSFHLQRNSSSLIQNVIVGTNQLIYGSLYPLVELIANSLVVFVLLALMAYTDSLLLVMMLAILLPILLLFRYLSRWFQRWGEIEHRALESIIRVINHGLGGIKEVWVFGSKNYFLEQMEQATLKNQGAGTLYSSAVQLPRILIETILVCVVVLFVLFSQLVLRKDMQEVTAVMGVFAMASIRLIPATSQLLQSMGAVSNATASVSQIFCDLKQIEADLSGLSDLNELPPFSIPELRRELVQWASPEPQPLKTLEFNHQVEVRDLTYTYPGSSEPSLRKLNLTIPKGKSIALIGKSGAGKTTVVDVLLGLLKPQQGEIQVDGQPIYQDLRVWQNLLGYIPQSIFLMDDTLEHNIAFGVPDAQIDSTRLQWALKAAQLHELVQDLPQGLQTPLGERGVRLSGGQRQRVGIARSLYHEREILVLDEATSALDNATESLVTESIRSLTGMKTLVVIAHRLSTIEYCDQVYRLDQGQVVQSGSYAEVVLPQHLA